MAKYCGRSPIKCRRAYSLGNRAARKAGELFAVGTVEWDAFKHIYRHALIVKEGLGFKWGQGFGRAYENYSNNVDGPGDLINNTHGAVIGQAFKEGRLAGRIDDYVERFIGDGRANLATNCHAC